MSKKAITFLCVMLFSLSQEFQLCKAERLNDIFSQWKAGEKVSEKDVAIFGKENCFVSEEISDSIFRIMKGKSFKKNCTIPRSDLRYIKVLHKNLQGETMLGEMVCNKAIASDLLVIFQKLYDASYPIERMVLIDSYNADDISSMEANNSSSFNFRFVSGTNKLSKHSEGMAVDINPLYNPYVKKRADGTVVVSPESATPHVNRKKSFQYKICRNDLCVKLFKQHGFSWGGDWKSLKDYQHFEK